MLDRVLSIEDNEELQILIEGALPKLHVHKTKSLLEAKELLNRESFSLVLLDIELPDGDGLAFYTSLKSEPRFKDIPVIVVSGKTATAQKVMAFALGVDDYLTKPFDLEELRARVEARLRKFHESNNTKSDIQLPGFTIDPAQQKAWIRSSDGPKSIDLTSLEFRLLLLFAKQPERVYSRESLLDLVWGNTTHVLDRTVDTHLSHLRRKISAGQWTIESVHGEGYRLTKKQDHK